MTKIKSEVTFPDLDNIYLAAERLQGVAVHTPLMHNLNLSERYGANIYLKREDLQVVRSYKIRGAFNKMAALTKEQLAKGVVCASAGNHAQGLAYACRKLQVKGTIFMPTTTPAQKIRQVGMFGKEFVKIELVGDTYDDAYYAAKKYCEDNMIPFINITDITRQGLNNTNLVAQDGLHPSEYAYSLFVKRILSPANAVIHN